MAKQWKNQFGNGPTELGFCKRESTSIGAVNIQSALKIAETYRAEVMGIVAQNHRPPHPGQLLFTPGIHLSQQGDAFGQRYKDPHFTFTEKGVDVMIVG